MQETDPNDYFGPELSEVLDAVSRGDFGNKHDMAGLIDTIRHRNDFYLLGSDFYKYV